LYHNDVVYDDNDDVGIWWWCRVPHQQLILGLWRWRHRHRYVFSVCRLILNYGNCSVYDNSGVL